jgi:hypothetical protein
MDDRMRMGWRESQKFVPNWHLAAATGRVERVVDVCSRGCCFVRVGRFPETLSSVSP